MKRLDMFKRLANVNNLRDMLSGGAWMTRMMTGMALHKDVPVNNYCDWEEEKAEILERAEWLCDHVIVAPRDLIKAMPSILGDEFGGQWAIYSCTHLQAALFNISRLYPEEKQRCLQQMERIIPIVMSDEVAYYDTMPWKEKALDTLDGAKSHMTYLSLLAWVISNYRLAGGTNTQWDGLFKKLCETLHRRMTRRKDLCLPSFPNGIVFLPDMMFTIISLANYGKLFDDRYASTVAQWLAKAKSEWLHQNTGLLVATLGKREIRGSYSALSCYCLTLLDEDFAREQYLRMKDALAQQKNVRGVTVQGIKEYLRYSPKLKFDYDAGPIVEGFSPSGTAWAIGAATYFQDWEFRGQMLRTAEIFGNTTDSGGKRHYKLGELVMVGEAVTLAMRTHAAFPLR